MVLGIQAPVKHVTVTNTPTETAQGREGLVWPWTSEDSSTQQCGSVRDGRSVKWSLLFFPFFLSPSSLLSFSPLQLNNHDGIFIQALCCSSPPLPLPPSALSPVPAGLLPVSGSLFCFRSHIFYGPHFPSPPASFKIRFLLS